MITKDIIIKNESGLQSRSAAVFIQMLSEYKSSVWIEKEERKANAKSLLGLLSLGIKSGTKVTVIIDGEDEEKVAQEIEKYLNSETSGSES